MKVRRIIILIFASSLIFTFLTQSTYIRADQQITKEWLNNGNFKTHDDWYTKKGDKGDNSTVDAYIAANQSHLVVESEKFRTEYSDPINDGTWLNFSNGVYLVPDKFEINDSGLFVYTYYREETPPTGDQSRQYFSALIKKNISVPVDMSNYEITSANLEVIFNATVNSNVDVLGDFAQFTVGDFVMFSAYISNLESKDPIRVAYNRSYDLGNDTTGVVSYSDKPIETVSQQDLIRALESGFTKDPGNNNITITLGIDIYCEDNTGTDHDEFLALIINSCNLTFEYEKKITKFSSVSWNQEGEEISGSDIEINTAILNFQYKIDSLWPTARSPFSEIRILINNNQYKKTIMLSDATTAFKELQSGGFDVAYLIPKDENITLSIELFLANTYSYSSNITLSLDNISLSITYTIKEFIDNPIVDYTPFIVALVSVICGIVIVFVIYETHWKYPPKVRKIRSLRKRIQKGKTTKALLVEKREETISANYLEKKKILDIEVMETRKLAEAKKAASIIKKSEEKKLANVKKAEDAKRKAEEKKIEDAKKAEDAKRKAEEKKIEDAKKAEEKKLADAKKAEDAKRKAEEKKIADAKKAEDANQKNGTN